MAATSAPANKKHNKLLKGAIATGAATALLLGGAGTFALWNDSIGVPSDSATINSGLLQFTGKDTGEWQLSGVTVPRQDLSAIYMSPGDTLSYVIKDAQIAVQGTHMKAQVGWSTVTPTVTGGNEFAGALTATASIESTAGPIVVDSDVVPNTFDITATSEKQTGTFDIRIDFQFNYETGGTTAQGQEATIAIPEGFEVTLTQVPTSGDYQVP